MAVAWSLFRSLSHLRSDRRRIVLWVGVRRRSVNIGQVPFASQLSREAALSQPVGPYESLRLAALKHLRDRQIKSDLDFCRRQSWCGVD